MSLSKSTDLQQIEVFRRIVTMLQSQLNNIEKLINRRDISLAVTDYAEIQKAEGREIGEALLEKVVDPDDVNTQIVFGIQSMRRVTVAAMRDLGNIKQIAMGVNGSAPAAAPPAVEPTTETPPEDEPEEPLEDDELAEELELTEEQ